MSEMKTSGSIGKFTESAAGITAGVRAATELIGSLRMGVGEAMLFTSFRFA